MKLASVPFAFRAGGLDVPFQASVNTSAAAFSIQNSSGEALRGETDSTASYASAVVGHVTSTSPGSYSTAVRGINEGAGGNGIGVWGSQNGSGWGVYGESNRGVAVYGKSLTGNGGHFESGTSSTSPALVV